MMQRDYSQNVVLNKDVEGNRERERWAEEIIDGWSKK